MGGQSEECLIGLGKLQLIPKVGLKTEPSWMTPFFGGIESIRKRDQIRL